MTNQQSFLRSTLSDLKNGLPPRRLADRQYDRGLVFVHVPKCAGSSVENALRRQYRLSRTIIDPAATFQAAARELGVNVNDETRHTILMHASEMRRAALQYHLATGYKLVTGHAPLNKNTINAWSSSHDFITILRDPIQRYYSHLSFNLGGLGGHGAIEEPPDAFLQRPRARGMGALYVKYFAGLPMDADFHSKSAINAAKENISRLSVVGFLDNLNTFAQNVSDRIKKPLTIGHDNKTVAKTPISFSKSEQDKIEALCAPDQEIYLWAKAEFGT